MKSFIATFNGLYIQDLELPEGTWIFSAIVKSPNQQYAFAIQEGSVWREFEVPLHTTSYRKISKSFVTTGVSKINIISKYASASNTIELVAPMLEGGTIGTPAKKHELDIVEAIQDQEIYVEYSVDGSTDWHTTFATGDLYMRQKKGTGNWSSAIRIVGEKGATGNEGRYKSFEFAKNTSLTVPPPSNANWTDAPPTIDVGEFLWMRSGEVIPPATTPTKWDVVRIGGEKGDDGQDGSDGTSVLSVVYQYALKDKPAEGVTPTAPTTGWSVDRPAWEANKDLWVRTLTTYSDNSTSTGTPVLDKTWISEGKVIAIEKKTGVFDTVTINTIVGLVMAKFMMVGDSNTNAGMSGLGTAGTSVRFWAGETFENRATANWLIRDDGMEEQWILFGGIRKKIRLRGWNGTNYQDTLYNPVDGSIAKNTVVDSNGYVTEEWYKNGVLVYEVGRNGIYYVAEIAESFTLKRLVDLSSNASTSDLTIFHDTLRSNMWQKTSNPNQFELRGNKDSYLYSAGQNVYSESNKQYEGYKNTQLKTDNITDGWYAFEQLGMMMEDGVNPTKKIVSLIRTQSGKVVQSGSTLVETDGYVFNQF